MAVQQNKKSPSKRGMHRSHDALTAPALSVDSATGEVHRPHHVSPNGMYRGRKVMKAGGGCQTEIRRRVSVFVFADTAPCIGRRGTLADSNQRTDGYG